MFPPASSRCISSRVRFGRAEALANEMIDRFYDAEWGGFFATTGEDKSILVRSKEYYDGAEPSGNSVAIMNLENTGNARYDAVADASLRYFAALLRRGSAAPLILRALSQTIE